MRRGRTTPLGTYTPLLQQAPFVLTEQLELPHNRVQGITRKLCGMEYFYLLFNHHIWNNLCKYHKFLHTCVWLAFSLKESFFFVFPKKIIFCMDHLYAATRTWNNSTLLSTPSLLLFTKSSRQHWPTILPTNNLQNSRKCRILVRLTAPKAAKVSGRAIVGDERQKH